MPKISAATLEEHRTATIDRLLDAFGALVMQRGYAEVSLADVASETGLARTAIYNYFPDREALLFAWTDREVERTLNQLQNDVDAVETCAEKLRIFVRSQLQDFASRHLPPDQQVVQFLKPETYENFMRHIEPVKQIAIRILSAGVDSGEFVEQDVDSTVPMIMACIGAERIPLATRAVTVEDATERVVGFVLRALGAGEVKPARKRKPSVK